MNPNNLVRTGLFAGLRYFSALIICGGIYGFIGVFVLAFTGSNPFTAYVIGASIGTVLGTLLAINFLQKNNIRNAVLIGILSAMFGAFTLGVGGLITFPIITALLGKNY